MKYTIPLSSGLKVFDATNLAAAQEYAESKGWNPNNVNPGDWVTYPSSGYPATVGTAGAIATTPTTATPAVRAGYTPRIDIDYSRATPYSELPPATGEEKFIPLTTTEGGEIARWTPEQQAEYDDYVTIFNSGLYPNLPAVSNIDEYWQIANQIAANEEFYFSTIEATQAQWDMYQRYIAFGGQYGDLNDYYADNFIEFIQNYDKAIPQLEAWEQEAGPEATGFTDAQIQEFKDYQQWYYRWGKPGDLMPVDVGDFITNYPKYQGQRSEWEALAAEAEKYEISEAEVARRREESYAESRYAAQERYGETPMYQETFAGWLPQAASGMSGALREYVENEYPSLRAEYEAGLPREIGYPTREEARAEAERRERGFEAWLTEQTPEIRQEYMGQRPSARGERYYEYSPTLRAVNW